MNRKVLFLGVLILFCFSTFNSVAAYSWLEDESLIVMIEADGTVYEWEYKNPDKYEYEAGNVIYRGEEAKHSFEKLLEVLDLSKPKISDNTIKQLQFSNIKRITIERIDGRHRYQTWVWNQKSR